METYESSTPIAQNPVLESLGLVTSCRIRQASVPLRRVKEQPAVQHCCSLPQGDGTVRGNFREASCAGLPLRACQQAVQHR